MAVKGCAQTLHILSYLAKKWETQLVRAHDISSSILGSDNRLHAIGDAVQARAYLRLSIVQDQKLAAITKVVGNFTFQNLGITKIVMLAKKGMANYFQSLIFPSKLKCVLQQNFGIAGPTAPNVEDERHVSSETEHRCCLARSSSVCGKILP